MPSTLHCFGVGVVLFSLAPPTASFSRGASRASCQEMIPGHIRAQPQDPKKSYVTMHTSASSYRPGQFVTVTVRSSRDFMGFLLQARSVKGSWTSADGASSTGVLQVGGSWTVTPPGTHTLRCLSEDDTITHSDKQLKRNLSFVWRAPDAPMGDIQFHLTVVQSYFVYWAGIKSAVVRDGTHHPWRGGNITGLDGESPVLALEEDTVLESDNRQTTVASSPATTPGPLTKTGSGTHSHKPLHPGVTHPPSDINGSTTLASDHLKNPTIHQKNTVGPLQKDTHATSGSEAAGSDPVTHDNEPPFTASFSSAEPEGMVSPRTLSPNITAPFSKDVDTDRTGPETEGSFYTTETIHSTNPPRTTSGNQRGPIQEQQPDWTSLHLQTSSPLLQFQRSTPKLALHSQTSTSRIVLFSSSSIPPPKPSTLWPLSLQTLHQSDDNPPGPQRGQTTIPQSTSSFHQVLLETKQTRTQANLHQTDRSQPLVTPTAATPALREPVSSASIRTARFTHPSSSSTKKQPRTAPSFPALPSPSPISTPPSTEPSSSSSFASESFTVPSSASLLSPAPPSTSSSSHSASTFSSPSSSSSTSTFSPDSSSSSSNTSSPFSQSTSPPPGPSPAPRRSLYNHLTTSSPLLIQNHISSSESNPPISRTLVNPNPKPHPNLKQIFGHESKPNKPNTDPLPKHPSNPSDKEGKYPDIIPRHSAWELGMLLGCSAGLGMVLVVGVRYLYSQTCGKRTEVTLNDRDREHGRGERGVIHVQECGDLVRVRKIRENSLVLLAEYDILASPGD